jgi:dihydroxyacid dehydratase/phosphogluconate dehydratase
LLHVLDGVDADEVILPPDQARARRLTNTLVFPRGNLAPEGAVVKTAAIDPAALEAGGIYHREGPARVFVSERAAMDAIKQGRIKAGDIVVLTGIGPMGTGMEETYQVTGALKSMPYGREVALLTDARFSGVSTGACIGHIGPEGLAGGPIGKVLEGDFIRIYLDCARLEGTLDLVGEGSRRFTPEEGRAVLARRAPRPDLAPHPALPDDTRLWAALQQAGGGAWGGCVYDPDQIIAALARGCPPPGPAPDR